MEIRKGWSALPSPSVKTLQVPALLPFEVDGGPHEAGVFHLARVHQLTVYDASYLELARRRKLPLATIDIALIRAAVESGAPLFGG